MFNLGPEELVVVFAVALLVLGPEELPRVARELGRVMAMIRELRSRVEGELTSFTTAVSEPSPPGAPPLVEADQTVTTLNDAGEPPTATP